jgi:hypothetical protein
MKEPKDHDDTLLEEPVIEGKNDLTNNVWVNFDLLYGHFKKEERERRLNDFNKLYTVLKPYLTPREEIKIDEVLLEQYINAHQEENRRYIKKILSKIKYINYSKFKEELIIQINNFNKKIGDKKYVLVIGSLTVSGDNQFVGQWQLFKSGFWTLLVGWEHLKNPYDIVFSLDIAYRLHNKDKIYDYLLLDDCSYSGSQLIDNILSKFIYQTCFYENKCYDRAISSDEHVLVRNIDKKINIHLIIPFISYIALNKINDLSTRSVLKITTYNSYNIKSFGNLFNSDEIEKINALYSKVSREFASFSSLIPIIFQHKIADAVSTIEIILIKGQVLDDPEKNIIFIRNCMYNEMNHIRKHLDPSKINYKYSKLDCPVPPYLYFPEIIHRHINQTSSIKSIFANIIQKINDRELIKNTKSKTRNIVLPNDKSSNDKSSNDKSSNDKSSNDKSSNDKSSNDKSSNNEKK